MAQASHDDGGVQYRRGFAHEPESQPVPVAAQSCEPAFASLAQQRALPPGHANGQPAQHEQPASRPWLLYWPPARDAADALVRPSLKKQKQQVKRPATPASQWGLSCA
jgi:hypothetical protein